MTRAHRTLLAVMLAMIVLVSIILSELWFIAKLPQHIRIFNDAESELKLTGVFPVYVRSGRKLPVAFDGKQVSARWSALTNGLTKASSWRAGKYKVQLGIPAATTYIPIRQIVLEVVQPTAVMVGGHSIGVIINSKGILIVGFSPIIATNGKVFNPAFEAGIKVGDTVLKVNDATVFSDEQMMHIIDDAGRNGKQVKLEVKRGNGRFVVQIAPVLCSETGRYRIGLWVRDNAAGVGTLSFYDPSSQKYIALGHTIVDPDTNQPVQVAKGEIVAASVASIISAQQGKPGEKVGLFVKPQQALGTIESNTDFGIVGKLNFVLPNPLYPQPIPVALASQVKEGPAELITVVNGEKIEKFKVLIKKVFRQTHPSSKGMVVKIVDPRLLGITGGIIQGMSGSPLIQDNKLVGVVTHVFVGNPTQGYAVFAEWMALELGLLWPHLASKKFVEHFTDAA